MRIVCKKTTSEGFDLREVTTIFTNKFDYTFGGDGIALNGEYYVMGIALYEDTNCLYYLIDTYGKPDLFPYLLFEVSDNSLPYDWFAQIGIKDDYGGVHALWGFDELCNDPTFFERLMDRDEDATRVYFKRKEEFISLYEYGFHGTFAQ